MFNKDLTVINKWFNKKTKQNEYKISHINGFWSSNNGISISNTELIKNDGFKALILIDEKNQNEEGYISPKEFQKNGTGWTLQNDDYIVKGIVEEITTIANLKESYECMKITNVAVKDYGSLDMQHYEASGS